MVATLGPENHYITQIPEGGGQKRRFREISVQKKSEFFEGHFWRVYPPYIIFPP